MRLPPAVKHVVVLGLLVGLFGVGGVGCAAHVHIDPPPPPTASLETRKDYFETHRSTKAERGELVVRTRMGERRPRYTRTAMRLQNGLRVEHVEDLAPLVPPGSDVARAIRESADARERSRIITGTGLGVGGVVVAAGFGLIGTYIFTPPDDPTEVPPLVTAGIITSAVGAVGGSALIAWGLLTRDVEEDARARVYEGFDAALRQRLGLDEAAAQPEPAPEPEPAPAPGT